MVVYIDDKMKNQKAVEKANDNVCTTCGGPVQVFIDMDNHRRFLACSNWTSTHHEGIARIAEIRRSKKGEEQLEKEMGEPKALALRQYQGVVSLTETQAKEIITSIWPKATGIELTKAMKICATYHLNPLMRHLYMIPFGDKLVCVMGIGANRLIASRKHTFSYLDDSPRILSQAEEVKRYGKADPSKIRFVTKLKDMKSGAEASGWGEIPANAKAQGEDKGNSPFNMAAIRSERQALDRLYPADMPTEDVPVVDDNYIDSTATVIEEPPVETKPEAPAVAPVAGVTQAEQPPVDNPPAKVQKKPKRTPVEVDNILTFLELEKALFKDFGLQPKDAKAELNVTNWTAMTIKPSEAYKQVQATRQ